MENLCKLCNNCTAKYSCPRCNLIYCSVTCYQSEQHLNCSESFFKDCVVEAFTLNDEENVESKREMLEMLKRNQLDDDVVDSDDECIESISERLAGVDLDNADKVWEKLTQDEKQEFMAFLKSEDVGKLITPWIPWWDQAVPKITEIGNDDIYPKLVEIKHLSTLASKSPSECVKYNLTNVVGAYVFTTRYFNGDYMEFGKEATSCVITLSLTLRCNQNFVDLDTACTSIKQECINCDWIITDEENFNNLQQDLNKILKKQQDYNIKFILCALSDLSRLFRLSLKNESEFQKSLFNGQFPNVKLQPRNLVRNCLRKIDYLLSFTKDYLK